MERKRITIRSYHADIREWADSLAPDFQGLNSVSRQACSASIKLPGECGGSVQLLGLVLIECVKHDLRLGDPRADHRGWYSWDIPA